MKNFLIVLFLVPFAISAQNKKLIISGSGNSVYINHTAAPKENFYSIGRMYNISPKEIAPFNNVTLENGVSIGQTIKVPLKTTNFLQSGNAAADEVKIPVYHQTESKQTITQLSNLYNKIPVASLKSWNNLKDDAISPDQNIIVGYLKVKKVNNVFTEAALESPVAKVVEKENITVEKVKPVKKEAAPIVKEEVRKIAEVIPEKKQTVVVEESVSAGDFKGGVFKTAFENTGKSDNGAAGIFKSTSGWADGKYYCLHNSAQPGSIVKITNPSTSKIIYAKVLDLMPDLKQNENLILRLSNSAADALGAGTANFNCVVNY